MTEASPGSDFIVAGSGAAVAVTDGSTSAETVTKAVVVTGGSIPAGTTYAIRITGPSYPSGNTKTVTDINGGVVSWSGLLPGDYTVDEPGLAPQFAASGAGDVVAVASGAAAAKTITNTYTPSRGALNVTKTVSLVNGGSIPAGTTYSITITGPSFPSGDTKTIGSSGGTLSWSGLLVGNYTVTEANPGADYTVTGSGGVVAVSDGATATHAIANNYTAPRGDLAVTKAVSGSGVPAGTTYAMTITGPSYPSGNTKTFGEAGGTQTWTGLLTGNYTVTEADPGTDFSVTGSGSVVAVSKNTQASHTVTNTYTYTALTGELNVQKVVTGSGVPAGKTFDITIYGPSYPDGDTQTIGSTGGTLTWSDLEIGEYYIYEDYPGAGFTVTGNGEAADVSQNSTTSHTITNAYAPAGSLRVTKEISGPIPSGKWFAINLSGPTSTSTHYFYGNDSYTWTNLAPGTYTVTEAPPGSGYTVTGSPEAVIVVGGATVNHTVRNDYAPPATLNVTKALDPAGVTPPVGTTYPITIKGPSFPAGTEAGATKAASRYGSTVSWTGLIAGDYLITETIPAGNWAAPVGHNVTVTAAAGVTTRHTITNKHEGSLDLTVTKRIENYTGQPAPTATFQIKLTGPSVPGGDTKTISEAGGNLVWSGLRAGSYQLEEINLPNGWAALNPLQIIYVGSNTTASVTNRVSPDTGALTITKVVQLDGPGTVAPNTSFRMDVYGPSNYSGKVTFPSQGGSITLQGLAAGDYRVDEVIGGIRSGSNYWTAVYAGGDTVTVSSGATASKTITNYYRPAAIQIGKIVQGLYGATPPAGSSFTINLTRGSTTTNQSIGVSGGVLTFEDLEPGQDYVVTENDPGTGWSVTGSGTTIRTGASTTSRAIITNSYATPGTLRVTKTYTTAGGGTVPTTTEGSNFKIRITGQTENASFPFGDTKTVANYNTSSRIATWTNLAPGDYLVQELTYEGGALPSNVTATGTDVVVSVAASAIKDHSIVNTFRPGGTIVLTKAVVDAGGTMPIYYFRIDIFGPSFPNGGYRDIPKAGGTVTIANLIPGTYRIAELREDSTQGAIVTNQDENVVVGSGATVQHTITNTFVAPGSLQVNKVYATTGGGTIPTATAQRNFIIQITGQTSGASYRNREQGNEIEVTPSSTVALWDDLAPGTYLVEEKAYDGGAVAGNVTVSGSNASITVTSGNTSSHTITNTFGPLGSLNVNKSVVNAGGTMPTAAFSISLTGPSYPEGNTKTIPVAGGTASWTPLIPGVYTVLETNPQGAVVTGSNVQVTVAGGPATAHAISNTYRPAGSLRINKTVSTVGSTTVPDDATYIFTIKRESDGAGKLLSLRNERNPDGTWKISRGVSTGNTSSLVVIPAASAPGGYVEWTGLPPGDYIVTETMSSTSGATAQASGSNQAVTVPSGSAAVHGVTNTYGVKGALVVAKDIYIKSGAPNQSSRFTFLFTGPSYPDGHSETIGVNGGTITVSNLLPGTYQVTELNMPAGWISSKPSAYVTVTAGAQTVHRVLNTYDLPNPPPDDPNAGNGGNGGNGAKPKYWARFVETNTTVNETITGSTTYTTSSSSNSENTAYVSTNHYWETNHPSPWKVLPFSVSRTTSKSSAYSSNGSHTHERIEFWGLWSGSDSSEGSYSANYQVVTHGWPGDPNVGINSPTENGVQGSSESSSSENSNTSHDGGGPYGRSQSQSSSNFSEQGGKYQASYSESSSGSGIEARYGESYSYSSSHSDSYGGYSDGSLPRPPEGELSGPTTSNTTQTFKRGEYDPSPLYDHSADFTSTTTLTVNSQGSSSTVRSLARSTEFRRTSKMFIIQDGVMSSPPPNPSPNPWPWK